MSALRTAPLPLLSSSRCALPGRPGVFPKWGDPTMDPNTIILMIGTARKVPLVSGTHSYRDSVLCTFT